MNRYQRGAYFRGCLNIRPSMAFDQTASVLSKALGIEFHPDDSGKYEEYPAYRALALGLEFALLAPPLAEDDVRDNPDDNYQLLIQTRARLSESGAEIDLSAFIEAHLIASTNLVIERLEHINAP